MSRFLVLAVGAITAVVCARLGVWQLDRLEQRRARNAGARAALAAPPINLETEPIDGDPMSYRRVNLRGVFDFHREVVVVARAHDGLPAVHIVTPLVLSDSTAMLVERGWVPSPDGRTVDLPALVEADSQTVGGVLMLPAEAATMAAPADGWPRFVRSASPRQLASSYPYTLHAMVLRRASAPPHGGSGLRPVPLPELTDGPHLSYAVQWFSFATIALVGSGILFFRLSQKANRDVGIGAY